MYFCFNIRMAFLLTTYINQDQIGIVARWLQWTNHEVQHTWWYSQFHSQILPELLICSLPRMWWSSTWITARRSESACCRQCPAVSCVSARTGWSGGGGHTRSSPWASSSPCSVPWQTCPCPRSEESRRDQQKWACSPLAFSGKVHNLSTYSEAYRPLSCPVKQTTGRTGWSLRNGNC